MRDLAVPITVPLLDLKQRALDALAPDAGYPARRLMPGTVTEAMVRDAFDNVTCTELPAAA